MKEKLNIAVLFGGCSPEYEVSLQSAAAVIRHMDRERFLPVPMGITRQGDWYCFGGSIEEIAADTWHLGETRFPVAISPDRTKPTLYQCAGNHITELHVDAAFPVLHGKNGEDGTVQGLFELMGIPVVGCGTLASALCMDKYRAHQIVQAAGIEAPRALVLERDAGMESAHALAEQLGYPLFVKPVRAGSSFGITKVADRKSLPAAVARAGQYDREIILEEAIPGFEVGCAVMGNDSLTVGEVDEIELAEGFFDYTEKYTLKTSAIHTPARIPAATARRVKDTAQTIYRALGCGGFARVDMFLTPEGKIVFNEVNTIPGFTEHSRFPGMMKAAGLELGLVVSQVIGLAVEK
ncbi:MAG: D-alanine--D-serine ligase VanG [Acutalibacter sp.]|nr:D-alanine--D-serine ligase VanG [Acutalibacter sp.]